MAHNLIDIFNLSETEFNLYEKNETDQYWPNTYFGSDNSSCQMEHPRPVDKEILINLQENLEIFNFTPFYSWQKVRILVKNFSVSLDDIPLFQADGSVIMINVTNMAINQSFLMTVEAATNTITPLISKDNFILRTINETPRAVIKKNRLFEK